MEVPGLVCRSPPRTGGAPNRSQPLASGTTLCQMTLGQDLPLALHEVIELSEGHLNEGAAIDSRALAEESPVPLNVTCGDLVDAPPGPFIRPPRGTGVSRMRTHPRAARDPTSRHDVSPPSSRRNSSACDRIRSELPKEVLSLVAPRYSRFRVHSGTLAQPCAPFVAVVRGIGHSVRRCAERG